MAFARISRLLGRERRRPLVAVIRFHGVIAPRGPRTLSLAGMAEAIERAFALKHVAAVALVINSPGGSPVQSALLHRRIRQLAAEKSVPVLAFTEDVAASGGYWLACAGDEIWAEETSIVGSIGVVTATFGFKEAISRLGIERRLYTAGERKRLLDPFLEENPEGVERLRAVQNEMHAAFKELVRARRGSRLAADDGTLFNGDIWTGRTALKLGLVDGIGDLRGVLRERFGPEVRLRPIESRRRRRWLPSVPFRTRRDPLDLVADLFALVEERLLWARFGL
ncbi:MAG: S49 family peptidase [Rhodospirillales bacterium]|nr:S49 family peptidase [Rhodospirillales bacterium]